DPRRESSVPARDHGSAERVLLDRGNDRARSARKDRDLDSRVEVVSLEPRDYFDNRASICGSAATSVSPTTCRLRALTASSVSPAVCQAGYSRSMMSTDGTPASMNGR